MVLIWSLSQASAAVALESLLAVARCRICLAMNALRGALSGDKKSLETVMWLSMGLTCKWRGEYTMVINWSSHKMMIEALEFHVEQVDCYLSR